MINIFVANKTSLPVRLPRDLLLGRAPDMTIEPGGPMMIGSVATPDSVEMPMWIPLQTGNAKSYDLQIYLHLSGGGVPDYAVQVYDGGKSRKSETLPGTEVRLDGDRLDIVIDYAFEPWMKLLADDKRLDQLTIPGTHDSATWDLSAPSRCQYLTLEEQLYLGIRYFDIRVDTSDSKLKIVHASAETDYTLGDVAGIFRDFLTGAGGPDGTQETVVMQLKVDAGDDTEATGRRLLTRIKGRFGAEHRDKLYLEPLGLHGTIKTLVDLRGKLVLMRRFEHDEDDESGTPVKYFVPQPVYEKWQQAKVRLPWPATFDRSGERFEWCDPGTGEIEYRNRHGLSFRIQDRYGDVGIDQMEHRAQPARRYRPRRQASKQLVPQLYERRL
jgi:hypothetical protein